MMEETEVPTKKEILIKLMFFIAITIVLLGTELSESMGITLSCLGSAYLVWIKNDVTRFRLVQDAAKKTGSVNKRKK